MKQYLKNNRKNYLPGGTVSGTQGNGSAMLGNLSQFLGGSGGAGGGMDISGLLGGLGGGGGVGDILGAASGGIGGIAGIGGNLMEKGFDMALGGPRRKVGDKTQEMAGDLAVQAAQTAASSVAGPLGGLAVKGLDQLSRLAEKLECTIDPVTNQEVCYDKKKGNLGQFDIRNMGKSFAQNVQTVGNVFSGEQSLKDAAKDVGNLAVNTLSFGLLGKNPAEEAAKKKYEEALRKQRRIETYKGMQESQLAGLQRKQSQIQDDQLQGFNQQFLAKKGGSTKKWIQKAVKSFEEKGTKGALTKQAKAAGKSISEFCQSPPSALAKKRCQFRKNVNK